MDRIAILLGGRIADEITTGDITTGARNDIEQATELARKMVCEWGMSDAMGPLTFGKKEEQIFLGREIAQHHDYSGVTAERIDEEVQRSSAELRQRDHAADRAQGPLLAIADALLARESLDADQVKRLVAGLPLDDVPPAAGAAAAPRTTAASGRASSERAPLLPIAPKPLAQE